MHRQTFEYGQNQMLTLRNLSADVDVTLETLWEDKCEVEVDIDASEKIADVAEIEDKGKHVYIGYKYGDRQKRGLKLKIPEYSNLDIEMEGNLQQVSTPTIDARMKGDLILKHTGRDSSSSLQF